ncbi:MAG TPA: hypothetical protein VGD80_21090 [Kofleriaceae bacterium]
MGSSTNPFDVREHVAPRPPPSAGLDRVVYGLAQPLVGIRVLATHRTLLEAALVPAGLVAAFCAVVAVFGHDGSFLHRFYTTFAVLAPLPSVVFANHYARFAVQGRLALGLSHAEPCIAPLGRNISRAIKQAILIALAVAPLAALLGLVPILGWLMVQAAAAVWALHWIVVDALDSARTLQPGETLADLDAAARRMAPPWYVRWLLHAAERVPVGGGVVRWFARVCDRLSLPWREEIALVEEHRALAVGFALSTAALLAIPVLNLVFRPIVIIGASHILGKLEGTAHANPFSDR